MATLIGQDDFPAIRAALDVSLDESALPDSIIGLPIYLDAAERRVLARDPDAATRTGTEADRIRAAIVYHAAALIAPALPNITAKKGNDHYYIQRQAVDGAARAAALEALAERELVAVLDDDEDEATSAMPTMFAVARGGRGA